MLTPVVPHHHPHKILSRVFQYETVVDDCTAALELDPRYVKALLRRQQANERLEKYDLASEGDTHIPCRCRRWASSEAWRSYSGERLVKPLC